MLRATNLPLINASVMTTVPCLAMKSAEICTVGNEVKFLPCSHAALPWFQNREFLDAQNFPNDVCIRWDAVADREKLIEMGYYAGLETPRLDHTALPYKVSRDQIAPESAVQTQY